MTRRPRRHRRPGRLSPALAERRILLASAVGSTPEQSATLARQVRDETADGLAATFGRLAREQPDPADAQGRLLLLLVDVEHRPVENAAQLIGVAAEDALPLLTEARRRIGTDRLGAACRGWGLVCRKPQLTLPELDAMSAHVELCRRCRERLADVERTRKALLARTAGVAAVLATAELVTLGAGGSAVVGGAGVLASKAAVGVVGALGAAVVAGGGIAAVAQSSAADPAPKPRPSAVVSDADPEPAPASAPSPSPHGAAPPAPEAGAAAQPSPSNAPPEPSLPLPQLPAPLPSAPDLPAAPLPVPSLPQVLPTSLPTSLPTLVVVPLLN